MNSTEQLISEIRQIKEQYEAQVTGKHKQWPRAIKDRVDALAAGGVRLTTIAERTGISYHTVTAWHARKEKTAFREVAVVPAAPKKAAADTKKSVSVTDARKSGAVTDTRKSATVTIKTPDGFVVQVNSASEAALIISGLRGSGRG